MCPGFKLEPLAIRILKRNISSSWITYGSCTPQVKKHQTTNACDADHQVAVGINNHLACAEAANHASLQITTLGGFCPQSGQDHLDMHALRISATFLGPHPIHVNELAKYA